VVVPYEWEDWALLGLVGIEPHEVRQVLESRHRWPRTATDAKTGLQVLTIWGRTMTGRAMIVAVYHVGGLTWKIIGSRDMTPAELDELTRWEETR
jgi:hypothetical protein